MQLLFSRFALLALGVSFTNITFSQIDSTYVDDEDYSMYDDVEDVGEIITYCSPKIFDLSPNRFISVGYDVVGSGTLKTTDEGVYLPSDEPLQNDQSNLNYHGIRINANIPVISKSKFVWQLGGGFNQANISTNRLVNNTDHNVLLDELGEGLTSINLNTTFFKPLGEKNFVILQLMAEQNGNYGLTSSTKSPNIGNTKYSATAIWGKRPHDRLQWGIGVSRTYRAGELNYIPVIMYNYTSENRKWGTEILFPARAQYRRKINARNILLAGFELEGSSYRLYNTGFSAQNLELRRSEIRVRLDYQKQLKGFIWMGLQAGVILNYSYNIDDLTATDNSDFYRGFFGNQAYTFANSLSPMPYLNLTFNLVSK
ncbi:MAG: DUF6268 family outer membrane beta-barrel protein [Crocinitomicaceae bacterium]